MGLKIIGRKTCSGKEALNMRNLLYVLNILSIYYLRKEQTSNYPGINYLHIRNNQ